MDKKDFYIGQILARCNSNLLEMKRFADKGRLDPVLTLDAKTDTLIEILENIFNYKDTEKIKNKQIEYVIIALENDYSQNYDCL